MKKVFFLMILPFLMFSVPANLHCQVTIGSDESPHPGAVLELKSDSRGLLLPRVALKGATDFLGNGGDKAAAAGMLVFNTGYKLDGPGLYVWTGTGWQAVDPINYEECDVPTKPAKITFSPANITVNVNTLLTVTADMTTSSSYEWTFPDGFEISGDANTRSIKLKANRQGEFSASEITVKAVNACGASEATTGNGTITVTEPAETPAIPTLTFPTTGTNLEPGDEFTITCGDVGASAYIWILPAGIAPVDENITFDEGDGTYTTTTNSITVTVPEGIYYANTFKVKAKNTGTSPERIGSGGIIVARKCSGPPKDGYIGPFSGRTYLVGETFDIYLAIVTAGPVDYQWTLPKGLSIVSGNGTLRITVSCDKTGTYNGSDIKVRVANRCEPAVEVSGSGPFTVVSNKGVEGTTDSGANTYTTYKYPNGLGTWMTQNSKEEVPTWYNYPDKPIGERGYYYSYEDALSNGCPEGWEVPTTAQFDALFSYLGSKTAIDEQNEPWLTLDAKAGYRRKNDTYGEWDTHLVMKMDDVTMVAKVSLSNYTMPSGATASTGCSVRCIKNSCDEAPKNATFTKALSVVAAVGGIDTIYISYRTFGPDTIVTWNMAGDAAEIVDSTKTYAVLKYNKAGTFDWSNLTCSVDNVVCGETPIVGFGECKVLDSFGSADEDLIVETNTYKTWRFPDGLGRWMVEPLREQPARFTSHPDDGGTSNAFYYDLECAQQACASLGWKLPTTDQAMQALTLWRLGYLGGDIPHRPQGCYRYNHSGSVSHIPEPLPLYGWSQTQTYGMRLEGTYNVYISSLSPTNDLITPTLCVKD
ncbi:MAG: hypothetical protein LBS08_04720 [Candidatus Symbiothrix sp.]|jgi:hypothetical protein|nr:hypothetical protein [Candidatus Symbiothrix sp.]